MKTTLYINKFWKMSRRW